MHKNQPMISSTVRNRLDFGKIPIILDIPNLIAVQQQSYERFLQLDTPPDERQDIGLQEIFKSVFPVSDYNDMALLEFVSYTFGHPKYGATECRERGMTYSIPLKVTVRLVTWDKDIDTDTKSIRDIKEQDIYFGEIPMMTPKGTFIINGVERTIVSQMHRSPGVFFDHDKGKGHFSGKVLYSCRVIPYRGSWLELEFDYRDYLHVRIDKKRKLLVSTFLRALQAQAEEEQLAAELNAMDGQPATTIPNLSDTESILRCFYDPITFVFDKTDKTTGETCSVDVRVNLQASTPDALSEFLRNYTVAKDVTLSGITLAPHYLLSEEFWSLKMWNAGKDHNFIASDQAESLEAYFREKSFPSEKDLFKAIYEQADVVILPKENTFEDSLESVVKRCDSDYVYIDKLKIPLEHENTVKEKFLSLLQKHVQQYLQEKHFWQLDEMWRVGSEQNFIPTEYIDRLKSYFREKSFPSEKELLEAVYEQAGVVILPARKPLEDALESVVKRCGSDYVYIDKKKIPSEDEERVKNDFLILLKKRIKPYLQMKEQAPVARQGKKITKKVLRLSKQHNIPLIPIYSDSLIGAISAKDVIAPETGEILIECNEEITRDSLSRLTETNVTSIEVLLVDKSMGGDALSNTFMKDSVASMTDALLEIYRVLRPGDPPTEDSSRKLFQSLFFDAERYDLSKVGRLKVNEKLRLNKPVDQRILDVEDLIAIIHYMLKLRMGEGDIDDIDHLGNRRVRSVGELLENQFRMGLVRVERATKERMSLQELDTVMPHDLINAKPVMSAVKEFFGSSQLSQFMDQTNPLSELTNKRRLSALGPGGLSRERAGFEMRDVHPTHYGRICPIETPEGPNIGLIASLSTYGSINEYGFIETPYRKVEDGKVTKQIEYLSAFKDEQFIIAQANAPIDDDGNFLNQTISARSAGDFVLVSPEQVHYMDISPKQLVSVSASLIPFLEHDDANRALMGSNMQRQGVPLLQPEAPYVGTGMEAIAARDSGSVVIAKRSGVIESVDSRSIVVRVDESMDTEKDREAAKRYATFQLSTFDEEEDEEMLLVDRYDLMKFQRSNQNTCINQRPLVKIGDRVKAGQVIADGFSTEKGELALGRNLLVAFMPWEGYNFEDAILISERVVKEDCFTSIHIEECDIEARDTKLGREEITRDIPNVGEDALANLDESGIVRIGAEVKPGDILVGKISPKGETHLAPEEKLLRAIFGEKAGDVKDASLRTPQGVNGIVIDVKVFSRKGIEKDERAQSIEEAEIAKIIRDYEDEIKIVREELRKKIVHLLKDKTMARDFYGDGSDSEDDGIDGDEMADSPASRKDERKATSPILKKGEVLTVEKLEQIDVDDLTRLKILEIQDIRDDIESFQENAMDQIHILETIMNEKTSKLRTGDELPPGVVKLVKVYIAMKRRLSVGDKMAGRHGNKGVVSNIAPVEDMPYLEDGTPVDIVLNPLGVPSRMNVGQILETCLGWASKQFMDHLARYVGWLESPFFKIEKFHPEYQDIMAELNGLPAESIQEQFLARVEERLRTLIDTIYAGIRGEETTKQYVADAERDGLLRLAKGLSCDVHFATPVFDGASEKGVKHKLEASGLNPSGKARLVDGKTGEAFDQETTVGYIYMIKLSHLVDDKMHARSIGPYSLVTQQPLGGKAQFGGQRFGEMEVWALEAYGAAYNLQELLTVKSDDVVGRTKIYESIVKGQHKLEPGIPESFNVLVKELQSLGLDIELMQQ